MASASPITAFKVLVVEDECLIAWDIAHVLEDAGAQVIGPSGRLHEAIGLLDSNPDIAAAVLDIRLHGVTVYPLADILRGRGIPFVFTSGCDASDIPLAYRDVAHCQKPFDPGAILGLLTRQMPLQVPGATFAR